MIVLYGQDLPGSSEIEQAKALLAAANLTYTYVKVGVDITSNQFHQIIPWAATLPQIVINRQPIGGLAQLQEWLWNNGY